ncbi:MAG: hypothetical protein WCA81_18175 [Rhizomicrobium sp.]
MTMSPEPEMLEATAHVARFMETLNETALHHVFADRGVTIIENFAPYIFADKGAVGRWATAYCTHAAGISKLKHSFGAPQDYSLDGDVAFFTLPTTWRGTKDGANFSEQGGWAFVFVRQSGHWRIQGYGWAVTSAKKE